MFSGVRIAPVPATSIPTPISSPPPSPWAKIPPTSDSSLSSPFTASKPPPRLPFPTTPTPRSTSTTPILPLAPENPPAISGLGRLANPATNQGPHRLERNICQRMGLGHQPESHLRPVFPHFSFCPHRQFLIAVQNQRQFRPPASPLVRPLLYRCGRRCHPRPSPKQPQPRQPNGHLPGCWTLSLKTNCGFTRDLPHRSFLLLLRRHPRLLRRRPRLQACPHRCRCLLRHF